MRIRICILHKLYCSIIIKLMIYTPKKAVITMKCGIILLAVATVVIAVPVEPDALQQFLIGNQKFTADVYKALLKENKGDFIYSPLSVETVLALVNEGAKGDTSEEFITGLLLPDTKENIQKAFKLLLPTMKTSDDEMKLLSANKIYVKDGVELEDGFKSVAMATDVFDAGVENVDFLKSEETAARINDWVADNTNQKIQNLVDPSEFDEGTALVLVNALYFSGKWSSRFENIGKKKFYKSEDEVHEVDTMKQISYLSYYENRELNAKFLKLDYKGAGNVSMVIVLPNEQEGLARLEENVEQLVAPQPFDLQRVDVELPKFTISSTIKFVPILQELGIKKVFTAESDLSGISSTDKALYISDVIQKAFINVTETGTEAAAATKVIGKTYASLPPLPHLFHADRPFMFYIKVQADPSDDSEQVILCAGRYNGDNN